MRVKGSSEQQRALTRLLVIWKLFIIRVTCGLRVKHISVTWWCSCFMTDNIGTVLQLESLADFEPILVDHITFFWWGFCSNGCTCQRSLTCSSELYSHPALWIHHWWWRLLICGEPRRDMSMSTSTSVFIQHLLERIWKLQVFLIFWLFVMLWEIWVTFWLLVDGLFNCTAETQWPAGEVNTCSPMQSFTIVVVMEGISTMHVGICAWSRRNGNAVAPTENWNLMHQRSAVHHAAWDHWWKKREDAHALVVVLLVLRRPFW